MHANRICCVGGLTVFMQKVLLEIWRGKDCDEKAALAIAMKLAKEAIPKPDDTKFYMRQLGLLEPAKNLQDGKAYEGYLMQVKAECAARLVQRIYDYDGMDKKYWLAFGRLGKFLGKEFNQTR